jgi:hypothetical protein
MTTKSNTKAVKPVVSLSTIAKSIGVSVVGAMTAQAVINEDCKKLHALVKKQGVKVGTLKSDCAIMAGFITPFIEKGLAESTIKNASTSFRKAVNEGKEYSNNPYRTATSKGASTAKSEDEKQAVVKLTIAKDATIEQVSEGLRSVFESKREQYAELVAFLVDALDEFEGK